MKVNRSLIWRELRLRNLYPAVITSLCIAHERTDMISIYGYGGPLPRAKVMKFSSWTSFQARFPLLMIRLLSRIWSTFLHKESAGSFPEQRLIMEPNKTVILISFLLTCILNEKHKITSARKCRTRKSVIKEHKFLAQDIRTELYLC